MGVILSVFFPINLCIVFALLIVTFLCFTLDFILLMRYCKKTVKVDGKMMDGLMGVCSSGIYTLHGTDGVVYCDIVIVGAGTKARSFSFLHHLYLTNH